MGKLNSGSVGCLWDVFLIVFFRNIKQKWLEPEKTYRFSCDPKEKLDKTKMQILNDLIFEMDVFNIPNLKFWGASNLEGILKLKFLID